MLDPGIHRLDLVWRINPPLMVERQHCRAAHHDPPAHAAPHPRNVDNSPIPLLPVAKIGRADAAGPAAVIRSISNRVSSNDPTQGPRLFVAEISLLPGRRPSQAGRPAWSSVCPLTMFTTEDRRTLPPWTLSWEKRLSAGLIVVVSVLPAKAGYQLLRNIRTNYGRSRQLRSSPWVDVWGRWSGTYHTGSPVENRETAGQPHASGRFWIVERTRGGLDGSLPDHTAPVSSGQASVSRRPLLLSAVHDSEQVTRQHDHFGGFGRVGQGHVSVTVRVLVKGNRTCEQRNHALSLRFRSRLIA